MAHEVTIPWEGGEVTGRMVGDGGIGVLLAHGAGTDQDHPAMIGLRDGLGASGLTVLTFNYPYTERGSKRPDRTERLLGCHRGAAALLGRRVDELFLAGRSMGGRMATYLVGEGFEASGVVLYAYPLHPAGRPEKLRIDHFPKVRVPMLFFQGTRDALSRMDLFNEHIAPLAGVSVELLEGAGHGWRGGGWTMDSLISKYVAGTPGWIRGLSSGRTRDHRP